MTQTVKRQHRSARLPFGRWSGVQASQPRRTALQKPVAAVCDRRWGETAVGARKTKESTAVTDRRYKKGSVNSFVLFHFCGRVSRGQMWTECPHELSPPVCHACFILPRTRRHPAGDRTWLTLPDNSPPLMAGN